MKARPSTGAVPHTPAVPAIALPLRAGTRRRGRGRPTLLDDRKRGLLLTAIRAGNRVPAAARYAGISPKSVAEWIRRGEGRDARPAFEPYISFAYEVDRALAHAEIQAVANILRAMPRSPRWAAWWLERRHPDWRRPKDRGEAAVAVTSPAQPQGFILVDKATLRRLGSAKVRAQLGEPDIDEATKTRGERPVSG